LQYWKAGTRRTYAEDPNYTNMFGSMGVDT
jgi:hypothetical protein